MKLKQYSRDFLISTRNRCKRISELYGLMLGKCKLDNNNKAVLPLLFAFKELIMARLFEEY